MRYSKLACLFVEVTNNRIETLRIFKYSYGVILLNCACIATVELRIIAMKFPVFRLSAPFMVLESSKRNGKFSKSDQAPIELNMDCIFKFPQNKL